MNWLYYILEANLYLSIFYIGYCLVLNKETHYALNRAYLLGTCVLAFVLPFLQLGILKHPTPVLQETTVTTAYYAPIQQLPMAYTAEKQPIITWQDGLLYLYLCGVAILLVTFIIKLYRLYVLSRTKSIRTNKYKLVEIERAGTAFSFFNYLFINANLPAAETIIRHEMVHIRQKHSADILFVEVLKIVSWFNPFIYLLQISLKAVHEYIADEKTADNTDVSDYSAFLVSHAYGLSGPSITHSFFNYNLLKRRIIMLHQKRSGSLTRLKYLVAVPIFGGLLCVSTLAFSKSYGQVDITPHRINPANTSPQVVEPDRMLLVTGKDGKRVVTDKFSLKRSDGTVRIYTAKGLSNKDREDLKKQGYTVDVVSAGQDNQQSPPPPPAPAPPKPTYTGKGYKFREDGYLILGKANYRVIITEKDGTEKAYFRNSATPDEISLLKNKYGYTFPTMEIYPKLPPPPPVPMVGHRPPPPPPARVGNVSYTKKGIKVTEYQYLDGNKIDFSANILDKDKDLVIATYFKSQCDAATIKMLSEKYAYTFPANGKYELAQVTKATPLPESAVRFVSPRVIPDDPKDATTPSPTVKLVKFPPPVVVRDKASPKASSWPPPPPPAPPAGKGVELPPSATIRRTSTAKGVIISTNTADSLDHTPVVVVNGAVYNLKEQLKKGQQLSVNADSVNAIIYTGNDLKTVIAQYGQNAKNGVIYAHGKTVVKIN